MALLAGGLLGCALDVQVIPYPEAVGLAPRAPGCEVKLLEWHRMPAPECRDVGDVYVGDSGPSVFRCGREHVEALVRSEACRLGADLALVRRIGDPVSSCYQARARLLHCAASGNARRP